MDEAWAMGLARRLACLPSDQRRRVFRRLTAPQQRAVAEAWCWRAHGGQKEPPASAGAGPGDWRIWLLMAGRGFGKTRAGAEWVWARARECPDARIALVGATLDEVARVMVTGPSGLLATARAGEEALWFPGRRLFCFPSGAEAVAFSAERPEALRGPQHHFAWCDELAKWRHGDATWDNLRLGLRVGERPRALVTTTPRAVPLLHRIRGLDGFVETRGASAENAHLAADFLGAMEAAYGGTRLGRQELGGELIEDVEGSLWPRGLIEACRIAGMGTVTDDCPRFRRVVVGVDPPATAAGTCGISVCGLREDGVILVLADLSEAGLSPDGWARAVQRAAERWGADRVIAEANQGGDMVKSVLKAAGPSTGSGRASLPVKLVRASRGKVGRAEPVATLFENGEALFAGRFPALEDELAGLTTGGGYAGPGQSPDRADAMVWAMTELMSTPALEPRVRGF